MTTHFNPNTIKGLQINTRKSPAAVSNILQIAKDNKTDIILISEPPMNKLQKITSSSGATAIHSSNGQPKASIIILNNSLKYILKTSLSSAHIVTIEIPLTSAPLIISSVYIPQSEDEPVLNLLQSICSEARKQKKQILIGGDMYAHHELWGNRYNDKRGDSLLEIIIQNSLLIENDITKHTYEQTGIDQSSKSLIDLTLTQEHKDTISN